MLFRSPTCVLQAARGTHNRHSAIPASPSSVVRAVHTFQMFTTALSLLGGSLAPPTTALTVCQVCSCRDDGARLL